jgi:hypothetical protein
MSSDPIRGQTIRFTFTDGPMAGKTFEHVFDRRGTVTFRAVTEEASSSVGKKTHNEGKNRPAPKYEIVMVREDVGAISYLGSSGYTLTVVLDFKTKKLVAFSSNDKGVAVQRGTFEYVAARVSEAGDATISAP